MVWTAKPSPCHRSTVVKHFFLPALLKKKYATSWSRSHSLVKILSKVALLWLLEKKSSLNYCMVFYRVHNMPLNPGRIRPWGWLFFLDYLNELVPVAVLVNGIGGPYKLIQAHVHEWATSQSPGAEWKQDRITVVRSLGAWLLQQICLLMVRKRWRQSCVLLPTPGIMVSVSEGNSEPQPFVHCISLQAQG